MVIKNKKISDILNLLYYSKSSKVIYSGNARLLFEAAKKFNSKIKYETVEKFLKLQKSHVLNKAVKYKFPRTHIRGDGVFTCNNTHSNTALVMHIF